MMQYASQGVRNAARKASNAVTHHHGGHNGPGGGTTARSIHLPNTLHGISRLGSVPAPINSLEAIRPRNPAHKLFSISKNLLQRCFAHLTAPGLRAPTQQLEYAGARSLQSAAGHARPIHGSLSAPVRHALKSNALYRQSHTFLPRGSPAPPPSCGGVAQVGIGSVRNFTTGRPIFQQLAENVPVAVRALYEAELNLDAKKKSSFNPRFSKQHANKLRVCSSEMAKPHRVMKSSKTSINAALDKSNTQDEFEHYFPAAEVAQVTTYLLIPLAPPPSGRLPLEDDPMYFHGFTEATLLPHLHVLSAIHSSYSTHALQVSNLFARLDAANVWARGVHCSAFSHRNASYTQLPSADTGICSILKIEFVGWTKAEVRGVIGETGTGWCVLQESHEKEDERMSDCDSDILHDPSPPFTTDFESTKQVSFDPAQTLVLPTIDVCSSFSSSIPPHEHLSHDPWADDIYIQPSASSSFSDLSDMSLSSHNWLAGSPSVAILRLEYPLDHSADPWEDLF